MFAKVGELQKNLKQDQEVLIENAISRIRNEMTTEQLLELQNYGKLLKKNLPENEHQTNGINKTS